MSLARRLACLAGIAMVFLSASVASASATDYAIGSDAKSIKVDQAIHPGQTVTLPAFGIYNKGTKPADYVMAVVAAGKTDGINPSWITFSPRTFSLDPGGAAKVQATVFVPSGALPGTYKALLAGRIVDPGGSGVTMSVGIGPMLTIQVAKGWWLSAGWYAFSGFFGRSAPWSYLGSIVVVFAVIAAILALLSRKSARRAREGDAAEGDAEDSGLGSRGESVQSQA